MKFFIPICFFWITLILGCSDKSVSELPGDGFAYETTSLATKSDVSVKETSLQADSTGRVFFHLELLNQSNNQLSLFPADWELETADGLRSFPVGHEASLTLLPDSIYVLDFVFEPINSLKLYHLTGLKGDLGSHYKINCQKILLTIDFQLSDEKYMLYRKRWGAEVELVIFLPQIQPDFAEKESEYLSKHISLSHEERRADHGVNVSEREILVDGLNVDFSSYAFRDSLSIVIRITNHSPFTTSIQASSIELQFDSVLIKPILTNEIDYLEIPRSQRAVIQLKYPLPVMRKTSFLLDASSFTFYVPTPVKVFYLRRIAFKSMDL